MHQSRQECGDSTYPRGNERLVHRACTSSRRFLPLGRFGLASMEPWGRQFRIAARSPYERSPAGGAQYHQSWLVFLRRGRSARCHMPEAGCWREAGFPSVVVRTRISQGSLLIENADTSDDEIGGREIGGEGNVVDVADPHQGPNVRVVGHGGQRVNEEEHGVYFLAGDP